MSADRIDDADVRPLKRGTRGSATGVQPRPEAQRAPRPESTRDEARSAHLRARGGPSTPVASTGPAVDHRAAFESVQVRLDARICGDLTRASKKEWLVTNGLGGYAMSTIAGLNTRRHHGLLVAATRPPVGRAVVLSKMDETLDLPAGPLALDTNFYPGVVHPRGFEHIESFHLYPFPTTTFSGAGWRLEKTVYLVHGENTVVVTYRMLPAFRPRRAAKKGKAPQPQVANAGSPMSDRGPSSQDAVAGQPSRADLLAGVWAEGAAKSRSGNEAVFASPLERLRLRLRPLFAFRDVTVLAGESDRIQPTFGVRGYDANGSIVRFTPYSEWEPVYLVCREARFVESADWYKNVEYPQERYRGLEFREDLWSYGYYEIDLQVGESISIACTMHPPEKRAPGWPIEREIERRAAILAQGVDDQPFSRRLALAAEQFLVRRERDVTSIVAGYPWFADRSRDTLIALPGLLLVTGRHREAKAVLRAYARALDRGMLPSRFPDGNERPEFGSVDATLWFFVAIFKYLQYTGDFDFVKTELRIPMLETIRYYGEGTRYGIRVDPDGLLRCGEPGMALTWMNARAGDAPLTPRSGKPVEINALWYNALKIMERLAERFSIPSDMARFARMAEQVEESFFDTFWNPTTNCLYDVVDGSRRDGAIRPNQILAVSLPFPLLDSESAQSIVGVVGQRLLTPFGLRTLDPQHADYRGIYDGDDRQRDAAYHQGTVWSWLLGPYIAALVKANGAAGRLEAAKLVKPFEQHLLEDGLGQISEIFWGNAPHWPRGCIASTASVGELLRAYYEDVLGLNPGRQPGVQEPVLRPR